MLDIPVGFSLYICIPFIAMIYTSPCLLSLYLLSYVMPPFAPCVISLCYPQFSFIRIAYVILLTLRVLSWVSLRVQYSLSVFNFPSVWFFRTYWYLINQWSSVNLIECKLSRLRSNISSGFTFSWVLFSTSVLLYNKTIFYFNNLLYRILINN